MKLIFDLECNGLQPDTIWMIAAEDLEGNKYFYTDHEDGYPSLLAGVKLLKQADTLIGHNIIAFDLPVIKRLLGWEPTTQKIVDTMLLSQLNDFERPQFDPYVKSAFAGKHNMKIWSKFLGGQEKHDDPSWLEYSVEMRERCVSDVSINVKMYRWLMQEVLKIREVQPAYGKTLKLEHDFAQAMAEQEANGWLMDLKAAQALLNRVNVRMAEIELDVEPQLKPRTIYTDKEPREAKVLKDGRYDRVTREWFKDKPVQSPYRRYRIVDMNLGNNEAVMDLLYEQGWQPTEWTWGRTEDGKYFKKGPKLTEDSYESITGNLGRLVGEWRTMRARRGFIEGIFKNVRADGRLPCRAFVIGTNTFRCRHSGIVNVPGGNALLGKEIRQLFIASPGTTLVSADSDSNQLRGMAHYIDNAAVSNAIVSGSNEDGTDIHSRTASIVGVSRPVVKTLTYALLFGAGDSKLGEEAGDKGSGKQVRAKMEGAYEGLKQFIDKLQYSWDINLHTYGRGFVYGLGGHRVYSERHKCFNALLQAFEAAVCKAACVESQRLIKLEGLDAKLLAHVHDEYTYEVANKDAKRVAEIMEYSLGPYVTKLFSINLKMGGSAAMGRDWSEIH